MLGKDLNPYISCSADVQIREHLKKTEGDVCVKLFLMSVRLAVQEIPTAFALLFRNKDKFRSALRTDISTLHFIHSGEKAVSPNFQWDVPALMENLSITQAILRPILYTHFTMAVESRGQ